MRWYKKDEIITLSEAEKAEVRARQRTPEGRTAVKDAKMLSFVVRVRNKSDQALNLTTNQIRS